MTEKQYFHVVGWFKPASGIARVLYFDLSEGDLKRKFLKPYNRGERILSQGETFDLMGIESVEIIRTSQPFAEVIKQLEDDFDTKTLNRIESGVFVLNLPPTKEAIVEAGTKVTARYITAPAGNRQGPGPVRLVLEHPIISGIIATVIAAVFLALVLGIGD